MSLMLLSLLVVAVRVAQGLRSDVSQWYLSVRGTIPAVEYVPVGHRVLLGCCILVLAVAIRRVNRGGDGGGFGRGEVRTTLPIVFVAVGVVVGVVDVCWLLLLLLLLAVTVRVVRRVDGGSGGD